MANGEINATDLTEETTSTLSGNEQFVMFDPVEGKRADIDAVATYIAGDKTQLQTTEKNSIVGAINEVNGKAADLKEDLDALTSKVDISSTLITKTAYLGNSDIQYWGSGSWGVIYFPCEENTKYIINKTAGNKFICCYTKTTPAQGVAIYDKTDFGDATSAVFTTGADAEYVLIQVTNDSSNINAILAATSVVTSNGAKDNEARSDILSLKQDITKVIGDGDFSDIFADITWSEGQYVGTNGSGGSASGLRVFADKFPVHEGDVFFFFNPTYSFRFVCAYNGDTAISDKGAENRGVYIVPSGINYVKITEYTSYGADPIYYIDNSKVRVCNIKNTPMGFMSNADDMNDGEQLKLLYMNVKNKNVITFYANVTTMGTVKLGKQGNTYVEVDSTNIVITHDSIPATVTVPHGLTIGRTLLIQIENDESVDCSLIRVESDGERFDYTTPQRFLMDEGIVYAVSDGSVLTDCKLSWASKNVNAPIWIFGDSYLSWYSSRWPYYASEDNNLRCSMLNGYAGQRSQNALASLCNLLQITVPKEVVWCLGMNDPDTSSAVNMTWNSVYETIKVLADTYGFDLVLYTTPTTPIMNNNFKNAIVRASGYRYVDADNAVRINNNGDWVNGALDNDQVHPTEKGAKILYERFLADLPEMVCNY